jgi:CubicO group peptidase (beta-lactamase class C family)
MSHLSRRHVLLGMGATLMASPATPLAAATFEWQPVAPADAGFAPDLEARLDKLIADKRAWNLHGVVIVRSGRLVLERYFAGPDWAVTRNLGNVAFGPGTLHDLRSVTKSIVGLLYGIALEQGKVPPPEAPLFASFPAYADLAAGRERLTIHHVLSMTMGTDWDESTIPYTDPTNSEIAMEFAPDRYRYILERRVVGEPGKRWTYSGGATALLGRIIADGTAKPLPDFACDVLFDPLGIGPTEWFAGRDGVHSAASGLRMTPRDLARIGLLMLGGGVWQDRRIVSAHWLEKCVEQIVSCDEFRRFGYHWYVGDLTVGTAPKARLERWWGCNGNGGQRLYVMPGLDLAVAITAGNYSAHEQWVPPNRVLREVVLPSIV